MPFKRSWIMALICFFACAQGIIFAAGSVEGTFTVDGKSYTLSNIYSQYKEDPFEKGKMQLTLLFSDTPLSVNPFEQVFDLVDMAKAGKVHAAEFIIDNNKTIAGKTLFHNAWDDAQLTLWGEKTPADSINISASTAEGSIERDGEQLGHKWSVKVKFKVGLESGSQAKTQSGTALPAGGGDPGKAYKQYLEAMRAGDLDALRVVLVAERAKDLDDPEVKEMLPVMQSLMAKDIQITGGSTDGANAWLQATGKDPDGGTATGEIEMKKENGEWKVVKDSWKSKAQ